MLIYLLDDNFEILLPTDLTTSIQWNTKYYDIGDFEIHISMPQKQIDDGTLEKCRKSAYVYLMDTEYTGMIQSHEYANYDFIIKGLTLEAILADRVVDTQFAMNGKAEDVARALVDKFIINPTNSNWKIPNIYLGEYNGLGEVIAYSQRGKHVNESAGEILYTRELSYRLRYDFEDNKIYFEVFEGLDRTQNQNINTRAVFSKGRGNIIHDSEAYTYSYAYKNFAWVAGAGEGASRVIVTVNRVNKGEKIKMLWVDARDLQQTDTNYTNQLITRGEQKLSDYQQIESAQFKIHTTADIVFSIGDKCEYVNSDLSVTAEGRITEINEVWEPKGYEKSIVFGEQRLGLTQQIARALS